MNLKDAIAVARKREEAKESLEALRHAIKYVFGEDIGHWFEPAYVIGEDETPEARFTHNRVQLSLSLVADEWVLATTKDEERLSGEWEDSDEACDELLVAIDDLTSEQSA